MDIPISTFQFKLFFVIYKDTQRLAAGPYSGIGPAKSWITRRKRYNTNANLNNYVIYTVTQVKEYDPLNP
jgi:hypothetical protein